MIRTRSTKHGAGTYERQVSPVQGDARGEIRNGHPAKPYLPADPGRRARLLALLGWNTGSAGEVSTTEYEQEADDAEPATE